VTRARNLNCFTAPSVSGRKELTSGYYGQDVGLAAGARIRLASANPCSRQ
jgi:hypothetical protein